MTAAFNAIRGLGELILPIEDPLPRLSLPRLARSHRRLSAVRRSRRSSPLIAAGQFSEVTGLGADLEVLAHPEGGRNDYVHQLPVRHSLPANRA